MQLIKRRILLEESIDRNYNSPTYGTITATSFYINVLLTQNIDDMGMFTDIIYLPNYLNNYSPVDYQIRTTGVSANSYFNNTNSIITANTESRVGEVTSYNNSTPYITDFDIQTSEYINYTGGTIDGVDRVTSIGNPLTYVFDVDKNDTNIGNINQTSGLLYKDYTGVSNNTVVSYIGEGWNETTLSLSAITKEEYLFGIISKPEIKSDLFIDRGIVTIFEKHLKLSEITNLGELSRYGRGFYNLTKY